MALVKLNLSGHANAHLEAAGFVFPGPLHVDVTDAALPAKVAAFLQQYISSGDQVTVALPGMTYLAAIAMTAIHGLSGQFPNVVALVRQDDGSFAPAQPLDLQAFRNDVARPARQDAIIL